MKIGIEKIECGMNSHRKEPFYCCLFLFRYESDAYDKFLINQIIRRGEDLARKVNPGAANDGTKARSSERIRINAISGVLAEYVWKIFLNISNIENLVTETDMVDISDQTDLRTTNRNLSVEVRSSFPKNGLKFALCHPKYQFDVIGPYSNAYKPEEIRKDFYARTLYPFGFDQFDDKLVGNSLEVYLTGGATWEMFGNPGITLRKTFVPEDEISAERMNTASEYLVIPFSYALDTVGLFEKIKESDGR